MTDPLPISQPMRVSALSSRKPTQFSVTPDAGQRDTLALLLGVSAIPDLSFTGAIRPSGTRDFTLEGRLLGHVVQPCVVTLVPVLTRLDQTVVRTYTADYALPEADEVEAPGDDTLEPLGDSIDPAAVMTEAVALALPDYPRAPEVANSADEAVFVATPPGAEPLRDTDLKPFAGLGALRRKLEGGTDDGEGPDGS